MNDSRDDFQRCPGNSPFCLGMVNFDCCGTRKQKKNDDAAEQQQQVKKHVQVREQESPLSPSSGFDKPCKEAETTKLTKGVVPHTTAQSTNWACRIG